MRFDFPALENRPVTEAHVNYCRANGHATHTVDGVASDFCPRCGDRITLAPRRESNALCSWGSCIPTPGDPAVCNRCGDRITPTADVRPEAAEDASYVGPCPRETGAIDGPEEIAARRAAIAVTIYPPVADAPDIAIGDRVHYTLVGAAMVRTADAANVDMLRGMAGIGAVTRVERSGAPDGWERIASGQEAADRAADADFAAAHDAHMRATYAEPWEAQPTDCPSTGDPLTGVYGRTYAEGGCLLMQAAADVFGPVTGHAPVMLFSITGAADTALAHTGMGGARLAHVDTYDTWQDALTAMRWHLDADAGRGYSFPLPPASGSDWDYTPERDCYDNRS